MFLTFAETNAKIVESVGTGRTPDDVIKNLLIESAKSMLELLPIIGPIMSKALDSVISVSQFINK